MRVCTRTVISRRPFLAKETRHGGRRHRGHEYLLSTAVSLATSDLEARRSLLQPAGLAFWTLEHRGGTGVLRFGDLPSD